MAGRNLARAVAAVLSVVVALAVGCCGVALAAPNITIDQPLTGSSTNDQSPHFSGTTDDVLDAITLNVYAGASAEGSPVQTEALILPLEIGLGEASWQRTLKSTLEPGLYTAVAEQSDAPSKPVTFAIDTTPPAVSIDSLTSPTNDATPTLTGAAGGESGDQASVTVTIHEGSSLAGKVLSSGAATVVGTSWSLISAHLADGTYTAQATQDDEAGNTGASSAMTFAIDTTAPAVSINTLASPTKNPTPTLSGGTGTAGGDHAAVSVSIYKGTVATGKAQFTGSASVSGSSWSFLTPHLADGTYTAQVTQSDDAGNTGTSTAMTFKVDATAPLVSMNALSSPTSDSTPTFTGGAGALSGDLASVTVTVYKGASVGGAVAASGSAPVSAGAWSFTSAHLADGTYTAQASQADEAGNTGTSSPPVTFTVDTTAPAVTISTLVSPTNDATPTLTGGAGVAAGDGGVTVTIHEGGSIAGKEVAAGSASVVAGAWSFTSAQLADGTYTAQASQPDDAGNTGTSAAMTFTVDTGTPVVSLNAVTTPTNDATPTLGGSAGVAAGDHASVTVTIHEGSSLAGKTVTSGSPAVLAGAWSFTSAHLADGTYTAQASQTDDAGNTGISGAVTFTIDTTAPAVSMSAVPSPSNDATPTLGGTAGTAGGDQASVTVTIHEGATLAGKVVATGTPTVAGATWSFTPSVLADGTYTAQASQSDTAGNTGSSAAVTFTVDTVAPVVSLGAVASPTNDSTPTLSGAAGTAGGDQASVSVTIHEGATLAGKVVATGTPTVAGATWSFTPSVLADGTYTAQASQSDTAGNTGTSAAVTFKVDTTAPSVSIATLKSPTTDSTPTLTGTDGVVSGDHAAVTVTIHEGSTVAGKQVATSGATVTGGTWTFTAAALADGTYTAQASQSDDAGNTGTSVGMTFTVDTTAPAVSLNAVPTPSNDATPALSGAAGVASGDHTGITVTIHEGASVAGKVLGTGNVTASAGTWSFTAASLADGTYTAQASQIDDAGNTGISGPVTFKIDATPPSVSMNALASPTNNATPSLTGTAGVASGDHASVTVTIHEGSSLAGKTVTSGSPAVLAGAWSFTSAQLADGTYTAQVAQSDEAGNVGTSSPMTFVVDTTAPAVTTTALTSPTKIATPTLTGAAGVAGGDQASVTVTIHEGATLAGKTVTSGAASVSGASWSFKSAHLADGTYTAQASQSDTAGNTGSSAAVTFTVDTVAPVVSLGAVASPTNDSTPALSGADGVLSGDHAAVTVTIHEGATVGGKEVASGAAVVSGGSWTFTPAVALPDGTYTVQASQSDDAGNTGTSAAVTFKVDATAPTVSVNALATTNVATPKLSGGDGVASGDHASVTVTIHEGASVGGVVVTSGSATVSGATWSLTTAHLADGTYTAVASQSDDAGNTGTSAGMTFTIDTTAPVVSMNAVPKPMPNSEPVLTGSAGTAAGDVASVTITIYEGSSVAGKKVATGSVPVSAGAWSYGSPRLTDGTYTAQVAQTDAAGNVGTSTPVKFKTPPAVSITTPTESVSLGLSKVNFSGAAGNASEDEANVALKIYKGATAAGTPEHIVETKRQGARWTSSETLVNGTYTAQVEQSDEVGGKGQSDAVTFTVAAVVTIDTSTFMEPEAGGERFTGPQPRFDGTAGTAPGDGPVIVKVFHRGSSEALQTFEVAPTASGSWAVGPVAALPGGEYTVQAQQKEPHGGSIRELSFTVDTEAPNVTLTSPGGGTTTSGSSQTVSGAAGTALGDLGTITVRLYAGSSAAGSPVQTTTTGRSGASWSTSFGGLGAGTYTAQAEQSDDVGNVGDSDPVTFAMSAPPAPAAAVPPPTASFKWFPATPHTGETVSLISTSTDPISPIAGYAWATAGNGVFAPGEATLATSFSTPGAHVVQLRVTAANGLSSLASETIPVTALTLPLMAPFPVVRIAGSYNSSGAKISLLTVLAPVGATVAVSCKGKGCPKTQRMVAALGAKAKTKASTVLLTFRRFERSMRAGTVLNVYVYNKGQIGKFTRFLIRHGKLPSRTDMCLNSAGTKPIVCPTS